MKILLPYSTQHGEKFNSSVVVGGIEKFCHSIYETFDDVKVLEINDITEHQYNTNMIKQTAKEYGADIIICNWIQASFAGAKIVDSEIPILVICHENSSMLSTPSKFRKLRDFGHSIFLVNPYQKMRLDLMSKRVNDSPVVVDGYINSCYVSGNKPELIEQEYECCTIGRCDPRDKKPFVMKTLLKDTEIKNLLISNSVTEESFSYKYYLKNKDWDDTLWDLEHGEVMKNLSKCKTFFQTYWNECFSITTLEALSHGIPIILNTKNNIHSSNIISAHPSHHKNITYNSKEELVNAIKSFDHIDRKEIQDMTWEKHTHDKWKTHFLNCIDKTIERFKNKTSNLKKFMN
jgi:hypothetical protein